MNRRAFELFCDRRAQRALVLADRFPESREALSFYGAVAPFQRSLESFSDVLELTIERGPEALAREARELDEAGCRVAMEDYLAGIDRSSPRAFFARVSLQRDQLCNRDPHPPQLGVIRQQGDGTALSLQCALCFQEWPFSRARCPACGETELAHYAAPEIDHLEVQACEKCGVYLTHVRADKAPEAVPDVDEIAGLALDVWATEKGYRKILPNLIGI